MIRWLKKHVTRDMIRPLIYQIFTRALLALCAAELIHFFIPNSWPLALFSNLALVFSVLFLLGVIVAWMRLDGLHIPQFKLPRMKRKDPPFLTGDMADHLDDDIIKFDNLDKEEQDVCTLLTDLMLVAVCLLLAMIL